jgi:putative hydrolase of the HAD superfamily
MSRDASGVEMKPTGGLLRVPPVLFFDLDNTLVDHSGALRRGLELVCERWPRLLRDYRFDEAHEAFERFNEALWKIYATGAITPADIRRERFAQWFHFLGVDTMRDDVPLIEEASAFYMRSYEASTEAYQGVVEMLDRLATRHVIGIITNGFVAAQSGKLAASGLDRLIRLRIYSEEVGVQKPHPAIFAAALDAAGVEPVDALYVGDNFANDIAGAAMAGIATVWFNPLDDEHPQDRPDIRPAAIVHSISELAELLGAEA